MRKSKAAHQELARELRAAATPQRAAGAASFFKAGPGQYGEGDIFLGVTTPVLRKLALKYRDLALADLQPLLEAKEHELRSAALEILVDQHKRGDAKTRGTIQDFYLANTQHINNWDLVDLSCREIVGGYLRIRPRNLLDKLAASTSLWERRIAMVSTMTLVREGDVDDALRIAERLLPDKHDLIHKAIGWVLREIGDKDRAVLISFMQQHYSAIPRTALRYAIEHFPAEQRKRILQGDLAGLN